jgi:glycosyltransferase involved in cell wall biosynthesis
MTMLSLSAYVPCFNNRGTVRRAVESLLAQTVRPERILVIDDGSTDGSMEALAGLDVCVVRQPRNRGRGAARARAMAELDSALVASCDATAELGPTFVEDALPRFDEAHVAAVFGRVTQAGAISIADRWRGRHLFKQHDSTPLRRDASLVTAGVVVRAVAVAAAGGYSRHLRHSEDADLGQRLLDAGHDVVFDPALQIWSTESNSGLQVLERYWRWYAGRDEHVGVAAYLRGISYSVTGMAAADVAAGDWVSVPLSLACPHYQFWRSSVRRLRGRVQA